MSFDDGDLIELLTCSAEGVKVWRSAMDGKEVCLGSIKPMKKQVTAAAWLKQLVATASPDGDLYVTALPSCKTILKLDCKIGQRGTINALAFSSSKTKQLCCGGDSRFLELWNLSTQQQVGTLEGHKAPVNCITFGRADSWIASGASDGRILIHNVKMATSPNLLVPDSRDHLGNGINDLKFSALKKTLLGSTADDGSLRIWDWHQGKLLVNFAQHKSPATGLAFSKKHRALVCTSGLDKALRFYDISKGNEINNTPCDEPLASIDFHSNGHTVVVGTVGGKVVTYDLRKISNGGGASTAFQGHRGPIFSVKWGQSGFGGKHNTSNLTLMDQPTRSMSRPSSSRKSGGKSSKVERGSFADTGTGSSSAAGSNVNSNMSYANISLDMTTDFADVRGDNSISTTPSSGRRRRDANLSMDITTVGSASKHGGGHLNFSFDTSATPTSEAHASRTSRQNPRLSFGSSKNASKNNTLLKSPSLDEHRPSSSQARIGTSTAHNNNNYNHTGTLQNHSTLASTKEAWSSNSLGGTPKPAKGKAKALGGGSLNPNFSLHEPVVQQRPHSSHAFLYQQRPPSSHSQKQLNLYRGTIAPVAEESRNNENIPQNINNNKAAMGSRAPTATAKRPPSADYADTTRTEFSTSANRQRLRHLNGFSKGTPPKSLASGASSSLSDSAAGTAVSNLLSSQKNGTSEGKEAKTLQIELIRSIVEEATLKLKEEIREDISSLHFETLRQFHMQHEVFSTTIGALSTQIAELREELKSLREFS